MNKREEKRSEAMEMWCLRQTERIKMNGKKN